MPLRDADTVRACPACDSTEVSRVIDHERAGTDKAYRCNECRAKFDEPKLASARTASADAVLERAFGLDREAAHEAVFGE